MGVLDDLEDAAGDLTSGDLDAAERAARDASDTFDSGAVETTTDAVDYATDFSFAQVVTRAVTPGGETSLPTEDDAEGDYTGGNSALAQAFTWALNHPAAVVGTVVFLYVAPLLASSAEVVANVTED